MYFLWGVMTNKELRNQLARVPNYPVKIEGSAFYFDPVDNLFINLRTNKHDLHIDALDLYDLLDFYPEQFIVRADGRQISLVVETHKKFVTIEKL